MTKNFNFIEKLRETGLRPTKQRVKICEVLFNRDKTFHFTVENLDKAINKKNAEDKIALATIYNTVHAFKKAGHLKEILIKEGKNYFDTNTNSHHHFFSDKEKMLLDIKSNDVIISSMPRAPKGKKIKKVELIIHLED